MEVGQNVEIEFKTGAGFPRARFQLRLDGTQIFETESFKEQIQSNRIFILFYTLKDLH